MSFTTFMGIVENGTVRLPAGIVLPDQQTVLIVVADTVETTGEQVPGIQLADRQDAAKFEMKVTWENQR
jgi:hypothetical protein